MPRWGRPPGVRNGKQARRRATQWEDFDGVRFEEIDGDDDGDDGDDAVVLGSLQRHPSLANPAGMRDLRLRNSAYDYDSELSEGEDFDLNDDGDSTVAFAVQLAMRDKEDMLVEQALERIRRAQMLGKKNVRLSKEELDALDRRRKQTTAAATKKVPVSKVAAFTRPSTSKRRKSGESSKKSSQAERRRSSQEHHILDEPSIAYTKTSSAAFHAAPISRPSSSSSRPRTPTLQSLRPQSSTSSPLSMHQPAYGQRFSDRDFSQPASPRDLPYGRALPDDPQWVPRQRSSSSATSYSVDNYLYGQPYGLGSADPRLSHHGRRYAAGMPYNVNGYPPLSEEPRRGSSGRQTRVVSSEDESSSEDEDEDEDDDSEEDDDDDDDGENGVQVQVVEQPPPPPPPTVRKPAARTTGAQNNSRARRRKGR